MVDRLEATLATVSRLERFHGHLYNWYDTLTLQRLEPEYVSTVDSGNLAGHLLAVANACRLMIDEPLLLGAATAGIGDAMALAREAAGTGSDAPEQLAESIDTLDAWSAQLARLSSEARALHERSTSAAAESGWDRLRPGIGPPPPATVDSHLRDLFLLQPVDGDSAGHTLAELADRPGDAPTLPLPCSCGG